MNHIISGKGAPVVLLHSSMSSKEQWLKLIKILDKDFRVIAIDLFGYGTSEYPKNPATFSLWDEVVRTERLITELLDDQRFHFIGHSYGAATALRYAYSHQARLLSLAVYEPVAFHLLNNNHPSYQPVRVIAECVKEEFKNRNYSIATRKFVDFWSGDGTYDKLSGTRQALLDRFIKKVQLDFQAIMDEPLTLKDYTSITIPLCIIAGRQSRSATRKIALDLFATLPDTTLNWVDGGHMAPVSHAEIVNPIWVKFLRSAF